MQKSGEMPEDLQDHISRINGKVQKLLRKLLASEKEISRLTLLNTQLEESNRLLEEQNHLLQQQNNILKTSAGTLEGEEKKQFEKSINRYIKTIDHCISALNQ